MIPSQLTVLLEATLRALIAALAVWAVMRLLRIRNVLAQKAAWGLMLLAALAMPLLMRWQWVPTWAAVNLPTPSWAKMAAPTPFAAPAPAAFVLPSGEPETIAQPLPEATAHFPAPAAPDDEIQAPPITAREAAPIPAPVAAKSAAQPATMSTAGLLLAIAWILYLGVCAALLLRLLWGLASSLRLWIGAIAIESASDLDLPDSIPVRWSPRIASPVNIGSGILLPADYVEWNEEKLRVVVAHERSHIRQRDFYLQIVAGLYASLTWFSPLGWWLRRKLSELGEAISDRAGLDAATSPSAYAQLLLEFAALPRPTVTGVPMAHSTNLSHRIERLLNESSFRQSFSGNRRAFVAALIVPAALVLAASLVRVEAAATPKQADSSQAAKLSQDQPPSQTALRGQSNPAPAQASNSDTVQAPPAPPAPEPAPAPPLPPAGSQESGPAVPAIPPIPPIDVEVHVPPMPPLMPFMQGYGGHASCYASGDAYAIVGDPGTNPRFCGNTRGELEAEVEKARNVAHGHFLLFHHEGKFYVVDDPAIVSQIEDLDKALHDQSEQMRAAAQVLRDAGQQARDEARKATANIPAPDLSKEMAELNATVASLTAKQGASVSRQELAEVQREISAIERRVIDAEVKAEVNIDMSQFNAAQGKSNEQMNRLGAELGRTVQGNQAKIGSIIDDSLKNGKARPVD
ncbi:MAG: M56 family metallopeptidase [Terracidiphilus sp.]|jgi:beta-lactamase regulating signal transducer with metallopeptidase domain